MCVFPERESPGRYYNRENPPVTNGIKLKSEKSKERKVYLYKRNRFAAKSRATVLQ